MYDVRQRFGLAACRVPPWWPLVEGLGAMPGVNVRALITRIGLGGILY